jgi:hypothetical protein
VQVRQLALATALLAATGCGSEPNEPEESSFEPLVELADWQEVPRDADPFVTEPGAVPECLGPAFALEAQWLEIDTGVCNWVTLTAASRAAVKKGAELRITVSHFDLEAPEAAEAALSLTLEGCVAWEKNVPIPSVAAVYTEAFSSPCAIAAGENIHFHLHNHGQNNWQLQELSARQGAGLQ